MQQQRKTCTCANVLRVQELCPSCLAEWQAWRIEDDRQERLYAAYGAEAREAA